MGRPKRKRSPLEDLPFGAEEDPRRITPTPELQELYDHMRDVEQESVVGEQTEVQSQSGTSQAESSAIAADSCDFLQPPSPSGLSRSPSAASYGSLTRAIKGVNIGNESHQPRRGASGFRARRQRPLNAFKKAKAALMRKVGACNDCRARRVTCDHYDFSLFETAYQTARFPTTNATSHSPYYHYHFPSASAQAAAPRPQQSSRLQSRMSQDLFGIHDNPATTLHQSPSEHDVEPGMEILLPELPTTTQASSNEVVTTGGQHLSSPYVGLSLPGLSTSHSYPSIYPFSAFSDALVVDDRYLAIGRQISEDIWGERWECQWGIEAAEGSSIYSGGDGGAGDVTMGSCQMQFNSLGDLCAHFRAEHAEFREAERPFMWRCTECRFKWDQVEKCPIPQCINGFCLEKIYHAYVGAAGARSVMSGAPSVPARDYPQAGNPLTSLPVLPGQMGSQSTPNLGSWAWGGDQLPGYEPRPADLDEPWWPVNCYVDDCETMADTALEKSLSTIPDISCLDHASEILSNTAFGILVLCITTAGFLWLPVFHGRGLLATTFLGCLHSVHGAILWMACAILWFSTLSVLRDRESRIAQRLGLPNYEDMLSA